MSCNCSQGSSHGIARTPFPGIEDAVSQLKGSPLIAQRQAYVASSPRIFAIHTDSAFGAAVANDDDSKAFFLLPKLGKLVWIDAEIESIQLSPIKVVVKLAVGFLDNPTPVLDGKLIFECSSGDLSSCGIRFEPSKGEYGILVDWECLKNCAPGCISCGTNKWCWLGCAAQCVAKCW